MSNDRRGDDRRQEDLGSPSLGERRQEDRRSGMDRRGFPRVEVDIWIEQHHGEEIVFRQAGNLSAGGIYLEHGFTHALGTRLKLRFDLADGGPVEVSAEVVAAQSYDDHPNAASLSFIDLSGVDRERILTFLNDRLDEPNDG